MKFFLSTNTEKWVPTPYQEIMNFIFHWLNKRCTLILSVIKFQSKILIHIHPLKKRINKAASNCRMGIFWIRRIWIRKYYESLVCVPITYCYNQTKFNRTFFEENLLKSEIKVRRYKKSMMWKTGKTFRVKINIDVCRKFI